MIAGDCIGFKTAPANTSLRRVTTRKSANRFSTEFRASDRPLGNHYLITIPLAELFLLLIARRIGDGDLEIAEQTELLSSLVFDRQKLIHSGSKLTISIPLPPNRIEVHQCPSN